MPGEAGVTAVAGRTPIQYMTVCALKAAVCITGVVKTDNSQRYSGVEQFMRIGSGVIQDPKRK